MEAVAQGSSQMIGHYHYDILSGNWEWDDQLYWMHGYKPGEVTVDLALILSHKHPDDREQASQVIEAALLSGEPFSAYQRIVTLEGNIRNIVKVGTGIVDENRHVVAIDGFYIDVTPSVRDHAAKAADAAVLAATEHRAVIEQAKGMIMMTHRLDADGAFSVLRWWSQQTNVKLHLLAERLVASAVASELTDPDAKIRVDRLLSDSAMPAEVAEPALPEGGPA